MQCKHTCFVFSSNQSMQYIFRIVYKEKTREYRFMCMQCPFFPLFHELIKTERETATWWWGLVTYSADNSNSNRWGTTRRDMKTRNKVAFSWVTLLQVMRMWKYLLTRRIIHIHTLLDSLSTPTKPLKHDITEGCRDKTSGISI